MAMNRKTIFGCSALLLVVAITAGYILFCPLGREQRDEMFGYTPHPNDTAQFVASLPNPTIRDADPNIFRGDKVDTFLYRAFTKQYRQKYGKDWVVGQQGIGDCVSWAWAHGADFSLAVDCETGRADVFELAATESIYGGSRVEARGVTFGGWSDGSYGGAAAKWVKNWGIVYRGKYEEHDLTYYDSNRARNFGAYGNGGKNDNGALDNVAKKHPIRNVTLVRTFEEAAAAIQSGYPVAVCSGQGFSSARDSDGFCAPRGSWSHAMCFVGVRYGERPGLLVLNSWGPRWVSGPKWPEDQPDGSFWADKTVVDRMLGGKDSFAISGAEGFVKRDLDHSSWASIVRSGEYALAP